MGGWQQWKRYPVVSCDLMENGFARIQGCYCGGQSQSAGVVEIVKISVRKLIGPRARIYDV